MGSSKVVRDLEGPSRDASASRTSCVRRAPHSRGICPAQAALPHHRNIKGRALVGYLVRPWLTIFCSLEDTVSISIDLLFILSLLVPQPWQTRCIKGRDHKNCRGVCVPCKTGYRRKNNGVR